MEHLLDLLRDLLSMQHIMNMRQLQGARSRARRIRRRALFTQSNGANRGSARWAPSLGTFRSDRSHIHPCILSYARRERDRQRTPSGSTAHLMASPMRSQVQLDSACCSHKSHRFVVLHFASSDREPRGSRRFGLVRWSSWKANRVLH